MLTIASGRTDNSFAESAAAAGWATLSYDRLGVGRSAHPDGTQVVQIPYEIAQSEVIAGKLRDGSLGNGVPGFDKVVGVGHCMFSTSLFCSYTPHTGLRDTMSADADSIWIIVVDWCRCRRTRDIRSDHPYRIHLQCHHR